MPVGARESRLAGIRGTRGLGRMGQVPAVPAVPAMLAAQTHAGMNKHMREDEYSSGARARTARDKSFYDTLLLRPKEIYIFSPAYGVD